MSKLKKAVSIFVCYILIVTTALQGSAFKVNAQAVKRTDKPLEAVEGQLVIGLRDSKYDGYTKILDKYNGKILTKSGQNILAEVGKNNVQSAIKELRDDENINFAEVNAIGKKQGDVVYLGDDLDYIYYNNVQEAWDLLPALSSQQAVTVAVVDSGVKSNHPGLVGKVLATGKNFVTNDTNTDDNNGHGTQVAGIIASDSTDGTGSVGVAGRANVKILPVKVLDANGNGTSFNIASGIQYAADNNAGIINVSICGNGYSQAIQDAVTYAVNKGCMVICASGDKHDYAENYWPANCDGAVVVRNNNESSNFGKEITVTAEGSGKTTTTGTKQYCDVNGSSFAAAAVSGIAALGKIKFPSYTAAQIENLIKNTASYDTSAERYNHNYGYGMINAYALMNGTTTPIEIVSPQSQINNKSDINLKVKAVTPSDISKLEVYLNDASSPVTTITGNKSSSYTYTIPMSGLKDGSNKIAVKAYCISGSTYTDARYVREYKTTDHTFSIIAKDYSGNPVPEGTRVYISDNNLNQVASDNADSNGKVTFYNTNLNTDYVISYTLNNVDDTTGLNQPMFFQGKINSSGLPAYVGGAAFKKVAVTSKKADGTPLLDSKLFYGVDGGKEFDGVFDSNGSGYIYVADDVNEDFRLVNESEGYILDKQFPDTFKSVSSINFAVDSTVTKVSINDNSLNGITGQIFSVQGRDDIGNYLLTSVNVKNGTVYLSKNMDYTYYYSNKVTYNDNDWENDYAAEEIYTGNQSDISIAYGKPELYLHGSGNDFDSFTFQYNFMDPENGRTHILLLQPEEQANLIVSDSTGASVDNASYTLGSSEEYNNSFDYEMKEGLPSGTYSFKLNINYGPYGTLTGGPVSMQYTSQSITQNLVAVDIKSPVSTDKDYGVACTIYDNNTHEPVWSNYAFYSITANAAEIYIDKKYFTSQYSICLDNDSWDGSTQFIYYRSMPTSTASAVVFDNSSNTAKLTTVKIDDASKAGIINSNASVMLVPGWDSNAGFGITYTSINNGVLQTNLYLDKGAYKLQLYSPDYKYLLSDNVTISDSNSTASLITTDLLRIGLTANNVTGFTSADVIVNTNNYVLSDSFNIKKGELIYVTSSLQPVVREIEINTFDCTDVTAYKYCFRNYTPADITSDYTIDLENFTFSFFDKSTDVDLPGNITCGYKITSGDYELYDISKDTPFDFMNELKNKNSRSIYFNLYDASAELVRSNLYMNEYGYMNFNYQQFTDYSIPQGSYTASVMLPSTAANVVGNTFTVNITTTNLQKIRIMNPFDISKPAADAEVHIGSDMEYDYSDDYGYVYTRKQYINSPSDITIKYHDNDYEGAAIYTPDSITPDSSGCILVNKDISSLDKITVKASDAAGNIDFFDASYSVNAGNANYYLNLDGNGQDVIYLAPGTYALNLQSDNGSYGYFINKTVTISGNTDVAIDASGLHKTTINNETTTDNYQFNFRNSSAPDADYFALFGNGVKTVYISPGLDVDMATNLGGDIQYNNSYLTSVNGSNIINIGKTYTMISADVSTSLPPAGQISASLSVEDEFSNNLIICDPSAISAVISKNGTDVETLNCSGNNNGQYLFNLNSDISGDYQVRFVLDMGSLGKISTKNSGLTISTDGYTVLNITDPLGKAATNGTVIIGQCYGEDLSWQATANISRNGNAYIKNDSLDSGTQYKIEIKGLTADTNEPFIYFRDYDPSNTNYASVNSAKITVNSSLNIDGESCRDINIGFNGTNIDLYNSDSSWTQYSKFNLYGDKGISYINMQILGYNSGDGKQVNYILSKNNIDNSVDSSIYFDNTDLSKIKLIYDGYGNPDNMSLALNSFGGSTEVWLDCSYSDVYVSKMNYKNINISCSCQNNGVYQWLNFDKLNYTVKDSETEIHFGKPPYNIEDNSMKIGNNSRIPNCVFYGSSLDTSNSLTDADGFELYGNNSTVIFSQNGSTVYSASDQPGMINVPELPEGYYNLEVYEDTFAGKLEEVNQQIYIAKDASSVDEIPYYDQGNFNIYKGTTPIFTSHSNGYGWSRYIPKGLLDTSIAYTFDTDGYGNGLYSGQLIYSSDIQQWTLTNTNYKNICLNVNLSNTDNVDYNISYTVTNTANGNRIINNYNSNGADIGLNLDNGTYNAVIKITGSDGNCYLFEKNIIVSDDGATQFNYDTSDLCKLDISNSFKETPYYSGYDVTNKSIGIMTAISDSELQNGTIYVDKGNYDVNTDYGFAGVVNRISGNYSVDCSGTSAALKPGSALTASVTADKSSYNVGDVPVYSLSVKDGSTVLDGFTADDFTVTGTDIMHGDRVIKSFTDAIPSYLKGECSLRVNASNSLLGNISGMVITNVNNPALTVDGDINLDGIVDIYDLVLISKDLGKRKTASTDWDGRCNLDNSDNSYVIDIKDIAKAASNYNK